MKYSFSAYDKSGRSVSDTIEAADRAEATDALRRRGLFVTALADGPAGVAADAAEIGPRARTGSLKNLTAFTRQLAVLVSTGTPVVEALESIERQTPEGKWRNVLIDIRRRVEEGLQLSEAMEAYPEIFDGVCRSLVSAGESGGKLEVMLDRLAKLARQQQKIRSQLVGAMVYPVLLIFVSIGVLGLMVGFVLPRFESLFKNLGAPLPPTTEWLMGVGRLMREDWMYIVGGALASAVFIKVFFATPAGRALMDRLLATSPAVGKVTRSFTTARISRVLGVLLEGKVTLLEALRLTRQAAGNVLYVGMLAKVEDAVTRGEPMSSSMTAGNASVGIDLLSPSFCEAVRSGERTGQIGPVLVNFAEALDEDNEVALKTLTSLLEPMILVVLGLVVGFVAMSMFLPLFDLTAASGPGGPAGGPG